MVGAFVMCNRASRIELNTGVLSYNLNGPDLLAPI